MKWFLKLNKNEMKIKYSIVDMDIYVYLISHDDAWCIHKYIWFIQKITSRMFH